MFVSLAKAMTLLLYTLPICSVSQVSLLSSDGQRFTFALSFRISPLCLDSPLTFGYLYSSPGFSDVSGTCFLLGGWFQWDLGRGQDHAYVAAGLGNSGSVSGSLTLASPV